MGRYGITQAELSGWAANRGGRVVINESGPGTVSFVFPRLTPQLREEVRRFADECIPVTCEWVARAEEN